MSIRNSTPKPCLRHSQDLCMAYCGDCTTWHVARQIALRNAARDAARETADAARRIAVRDTAAAVAPAPRLTVVPSVPRRPVPALTAVA